MPQVLPWITGGLGILNAVQGIQAGQRQERGLQIAERGSEEQRLELGRLMAILSDPNNAARMALRSQGEAGIARAVSGRSNEAVSRLASMGWRSPDTLAGPLSNIAASGVTAQGDLERQLINDFLAKRMALVSPGLPITGGLGVGEVAGRTATGAGEALGQLLAILTRQKSTSGSPRLWDAPGRPAGAGGGFLGRTKQRYF